MEKDKRINEVINVLFLLADTVELYLAELPQYVELIRDVKRKFNITSKNIRSLVNEINKALPDDEQERFEIASDNLYQLIEKTYMNEN